MSGGDSLLLVLRMAASLALVLGLLVVLARYAARRGLGRANGPRGLQLEVLARQQLSRHASMQIVRVEDQVLLLGVSDAGVRVLTRLSPADLEGEVRTEAHDAHDTTGPQDTHHRTTGHTQDTDVDRARGGRAAEDLLGHQHVVVGSALGKLDEMLTREGRHRAARGARRRG